MADIVALLRRQRAEREQRDRLMDPQVRRDIESAAFAQGDILFWRRIAELRDVEEHPSPEYRKTLDKWFGDVDATFTLGGGSCAFCLKPTSGDNLCGDCAYRVVDAREPGYDW